MKKADKEKFYRLLDEMKDLINHNTLLSKKDIYTIVNELAVLRLDVEGLRKNFSWEEEKER